MIRDYPGALTGNGSGRTYQVEWLYKRAVITRWAYRGGFLPWENNDLMPKIRSKKINMIKRKVFFANLPGGHGTHLASCPYVPCGQGVHCQSKKEGCWRHTRPDEANASSYFKNFMSNGRLKSSPTNSLQK